jgi:cyclase
MRTFAHRALLAAALSFGVALGASAQAPPAAPALTVKPVKPGLFMVTGAGGNSAVRVTDAGVLVVDSKNPGQPIYDALMAKVAEVSGGQPVKYLVVTHHHGDHAGNTGRFLAAGVKVVGQKAMPAEFAKFTAPANNPSAIAPASPNVIYDGTYEIRLGGTVVRLFHFTPAHTDDDTIVYFPDLKVVATGDELNATTPNFDYPGGASIAGWLTSLDKVLKLDWDQAIPGHGDRPMTRQEVVAFRGKLADMLDRARAAAKAGTPKDQLVAAMKLDELWVLAPNYWAGPGRLDGLYAEASK